MGRQIHICRPGFENVLGRELTALGMSGVIPRPGYVSCADGQVERPVDLCFATLSLLDPLEIGGHSVNALAGALCDRFGEALRGVRVDRPWFVHWECDPQPALRRRCRSLAREFDNRLHRRMARVARLGTPAPPPDSAPRRGLVVKVLAADRLLAATVFRFWGQRRMRMDPRAPSRSYLKIEEAFALMGRAPTAAQIVVDLGAAPGGWSFSAASRGALVWAVDNGPLKGAARNHERIRHRREDAFTFHLPSDQTADWLLCDLIEDPLRVVEHILLPWMDRGRCRHVVVNLKLGRCDPIEILRRLRRDDRWGLNRRCDAATVRHLYHDRDEVTIMGVLCADDSHRWM